MQENKRHTDSIPRLGKSPGGGHGNPLQYSCLENPHGQRSLVGYSPWGHKQSRTYVYREKETYCKELTHAIMEAKKS